MEPTQPTASTPNTGQPLVEFVRANRHNAGVALSVLAVLFLAVGVFLAMKGFRAPVAPETPPDKPKVENPLDPDEKPELPRPATDAGHLGSQYHLGWIASLLAVFVAGGAGVWLILGVPPPTEDKQRTEARILVLAVGGLLGGILICLGIVYFYLWSESLTNWLSKGEVSESKWVLIPILMTVLGAGLVFLSVQPARAEERNNTLIRRLVYGSNFALTVLLLLVVLAVANVLFTIRVPNELDTTATGFYSISDETRDLLRRLDPPVTVYAIVPDDMGGRIIGDVRQLLLACDDASGGKFKTKFISPSVDRRELADLLRRYPQLELTLSDRRLGQAGALVLTTGPDEKRHTVIPVPELFAGRGFAGESRLFKELTLLADNQVKPVIYFTQSNGELSITPGAPAPDDEKAERLRAYLEKNFLEVRPLTFRAESPLVPDDAAVVVVAGPRVPFSEATAAALRKYVMTPHGPEGKKGKLIVLSGVIPGPGRKGVLKTGLEGLLGELNVRLGDKYVYTLQSEQNPFPLVPQAGFTRGAVAAKHPVALAIGKAVNTLPMPLAREVTPLNGNPSLKPTVLLAAAGETWTEDDPLALQPREFQNYILDMFRNDAIKAAKDWREGARPLGVVVSEGTSARAAVYGCADFVSDDAAKELPAQTSPYTFDLIGVTIDWLRERPSITAVEIKAKQYQEYKFPDPIGVDTTRLLYLPLALALLAVVGFGAGVWVVRRK